MGWRVRRGNRGDTTQFVERTCLELSDVALMGTAGEAHVHEEVSVPEGCRVVKPVLGAHNDEGGAFFEQLLDRESKLHLRWRWCAYEVPICVRA